eukprot:TRINITY_DN5810_c1_g1_i4.p1 TRINITY_DN5810_c1_g1~~TRINITY_DN5810_c1_g1_i4.p1  ORF type:complete len:546 (+),score=136.83 TRINITY_DN5810_c1_g1_i4:199-1836(+)
MSRRNSLSVEMEKPSTPARSAIRPKPSLQSLGHHLTADFDTRPDHLAKLFNKLDTTGSGNVSYDQMITGIRPMFPHYDPTQLRRVVEQIDTDGSGEVNQAEFITAIQEMAVQAFNSGSLQDCFVYDYGPDAADRSQVDLHPPPAIPPCPSPPAGAGAGGGGFGGGGGGNAYYQQQQQQQQLLNQSLQSSVASYSVSSSVATMGFLSKPFGPKVRVRWVCTVGDDAAFLLRIVQHYELHPLLIQDLLYSTEQSKLEPLGQGRGLCLIYPSITLNEGDLPLDPKIPSLKDLRLEVRNCSVLMLGRTILSFHRVESESIENCKSRISNSSSKIRTAPADFLVFSLLQQEVEPLFRVLTTFRKQMDIVQEYVDDEKKPTPQSAIKVLQNAWREMNVLMFHLRPLSATLRALASHLEQHQSPVAPVGPNLGNNQQHQHQPHEGDETTNNVHQLRSRVDALLQQAESLQNTARALKENNAEKQAARMNRIMHTLTLVTATFVPVQFLTGLWGMNFDAMPELHWDFGYKMCWILIASAVTVVLAFFKFSRLL